MLLAEGMDPKDRLRGLAIRCDSPDLWILRVSANLAESRDAL